MRQICGSYLQKVTGGQFFLSFGEVVSYLGEELTGKEVLMLLKNDL